MVCLLSLYIRVFLDPIMSCILIAPEYMHCKLRLHIISVVFPLLSSFSLTKSRLPDNFSLFFQRFHFRSIQWIIYLRNYANSSLSLQLQRKGIHKNCRHLLTSCLKIKVYSVTHYLLTALTCIFNKELESLISYLIATIWFDSINLCISENKRAYMLKKTF